MSDPIFSMSKYLSREDLLDAKAKYYAEKCEKIQARLKEIVEMSPVENIVRPDGQGVMTCLTVHQSFLEELIEM